MLDHTQENQTLSRTDCSVAYSRRIWTMTEQPVMKERSGSAITNGIKASVTSLGSASKCPGGIEVTHRSIGVSKASLHNTSFTMMRRAFNSLHDAIKNEDKAAFDAR